MGASEAPEALPVTTELSLRLDEVEAMLCFVSQKLGRKKWAKRHDSVQDLILGFHLRFILAIHQYQGF